MTRDEVKVLIRTIKAAYPNYRPEDLTETINLWSVFFESVEYREAAGALARFIATDTSGFAPSVSQILALLPREQDLDPLAAWALVVKAIRRASYYAEEEFAKLPPMVQKAVGDPVNLQAWSQLEPKTVHSVTQSQFIGTYKAVCERQRTEDAIPENVMQLIAASMPKIGMR